MQRRNSFTLLELLIVILIILVLSTISFFTINLVMKQSRVSSTLHNIEDALKLAQGQAKESDSECGLLFYVDPILNIQKVVMIESKTYPLAGETYPDVCDRYAVNNSVLFEFWEDVRLMPIEVFKCEKDTDNDGKCDEYTWPDNELINDNYQTGRHRNFFAIIYGSHGQMVFPKKVIIYDEVKDGRGYLTNLSVGDVESEFGNIISNIIDNGDKRGIMFPVSRGVAVYNEAEMQSVPVTDRSEYLRQQDLTTMSWANTKFVLNMKQQPN